MPEQPRPTLGNEAMGGGFGSLGPSVSEQAAVEATRKAKEEELRQSPTYKRLKKLYGLDPAMFLKVLQKVPAGEFEVQFMTDPKGFGMSELEAAEIQNLRSLAQQRAQGKKKAIGFERNPFLTA